jgi:L-alanine-DL-glutamate epimerase-like enolase superfamily enzyme
VKEFMLMITDVEAINLAKTTQTIVLVHTDEGITGVGHCDTSPYVRFIIEGELKPMLIGKDPLETEALWAMMYRSSAWNGLRGIIIHGMAAIDMALWDIKGQKLMEPIWKLLGGKYRDKVIPYASFTPLSFKPYDLAKRAAQCREMGFRAVKFGWGDFGRVSVEEDVKLVKAVREGAGDDMKIIIDAGRPWGCTPSWVIKTARRIEYDVFFLEEPLNPDDIEGFAEVKASVDLPIATGETKSTIQEYRTLIERRAVDILQPDPSRVGITQWKIIAKMAEAANIMCVPHDWSTGINIMAQIHLVASIPNGEYIEYMRPRPGRENSVEADLIDRILEEPFELKNGYFEVPNKPGLSISLNEEILKKYAV